MKERVMNITKSRKATRVLTMAFMAVITMVAFTAVAFAENGADLTSVVNPVVGLIKSFTKPLLLIVGAGGFLYCIILGVKYATAEEPQEREKRKQAIKTAIIGYLLIFILVVILRLSIGPLTKWMAGNSNTAQTSTSSTKTK